ncbi:MAG: hypothetical protein CFK52_08265 [Chloracidobacterium sp. CP2_5A]|nr:MAG: hypothetical protein CFK52_08265 [Chloracidobacterium sp. CP2_5A]
MSRRILIADDHVPTRRDLQAFFQQRGFEVVAVGNGDLAARRAGEMRPDLVVLDVLMPGKTGYEACRHIKQVLKLELPVLMIHHDGEPFDRQEAERAGADETLVKPIDPFALLETINALWRKYGQEAPADFDSGNFSQEVQEEDLEAAFGNGQIAAPGAPTDISPVASPAEADDSQLPPPDASAPPTPTILPSAPMDTLAGKTGEPETQVAASGPPTSELPDPYSVVASDGYEAYFEDEASAQAPASAAQDQRAQPLSAKRLTETVTDQALPFTDPYPSTNLFAPIPTQVSADISFSLPERITAELQPQDPSAGLSIRFDTGNAAVHIGGLYEVTEVELPESVTQEAPPPSEPPATAAETFDEADVSSDGIAAEEVALLQETGTDILATAVIVAVTPATDGARHAAQEQACPHCGGRVLESDILCPHCGEMI